MEQIFFDRFLLGYYLEETESKDVARANRRGPCYVRDLMRGEHERYRSYIRWEALVQVEVKNFE